MSLKAGRILLVISALVVGIGVIEAMSPLGGQVELAACRHHRACTTPTPAPSATPTSTAQTSPTAVPTATPTPAPTSTPAGTNSPFHLGVYYCPIPGVSCAGSAGGPFNAAALDAYKTLVGAYPTYALGYKALENTSMLTSSEQTDLSARSIEPMVTVELYVPDYSSSLSLTGVTAGTYDSYIDSEANVAKNYYANHRSNHNGEILIRFAHEMNGNWEPWGPGHGYTAQDYVNAWQHYVTRFRNDVGASANVKFVWSPNVYDGSSSEQPLQNYWPGDGYIDYLAMDGYNQGTAEACACWPWESFTQIFSSSYATELGLSAKPVIIAETSSSESGGSKANWITSAFLTEIPKSFPRITAVFWFGMDLHASNQADWRINTSSTSTAAFQQVVASSLWNGASTTPPSPTPTPTPTPTPAPTPTPTPVSGPNLLVNGSFDNAGLSPWYLNLQGGGAGTLAQDSTTYADSPYSAKTTVTTASSSSPWNVQLQQTNLPVASGHNYTVTFSAKASASRSISVMLQQSASPYTVYAQQTFNLTTSWQTFTFTMPAQTALDANTALRFNLAQAAGTVWIDRASVVASS